MNQPVFNTLQGAKNRVNRIMNRFRKLALGLGLTFATALGLVWVSSAEAGSSTPNHFEMRLETDQNGHLTSDRLQIEELDSLEVGEGRQEITEGGQPVFLTRESEHGYLVEVGDEEIRIDTSHGGRREIRIEKRLDGDGQTETEDVKVFVHGGRGATAKTWTTEDGKTVVIAGDSGHGEKHHVMVMSDGDGDEHKIIRFRGSEGDEHGFEFHTEDGETIHLGDGKGMVFIGEGSAGGHKREIDLGDGKKMMIVTSGEGPDGEEIGVEVDTERGIITLSNGTEIRLPDLESLTNGTGEGGIRILHLGDEDGDGEHRIEKRVIVIHEEEEENN